MMQQPREARESGFVLIGVVWLLALCAALAAVMMARSSSRARDLSRAEQEMVDRYRLEAAVQTVLAELVIEGPRSPWWTSPRSAVVSVDGEGVMVDVANETASLDVNSAPSDVLETAIADTLDAEPARQVTARLSELRASEARIDGLEELAAGLSRRDTCALRTRFTVSGGSPEMVDPRAPRPFRPTDVVNVLARTDRSRLRAAYRMAAAQPGEAIFFRSPDSCF